jgi:S-DNA-T family DNA segregation ATPase FtsK/SpoIIIE
VDELFDEAVEEVVTAGKASASLLQRKLSIGYARAARILDELEEKGIVGPAQGNKPRTVLIETIPDFDDNNGEDVKPVLNPEPPDDKTEEDAISEL